jgi:hypothetical protein
VGGGAGGSTSSGGSFSGIPEQVWHQETPEKPWKHPETDSSGCDSSASNSKPANAFKMAWDDSPGFLERFKLATMGCGPAKECADMVSKEGGTKETSQIGG